MNSMMTLFNTMAQNINSHTRAWKVSILQPVKMKISFSLFRKIGEKQTYKRVIRTRVSNESQRVDIDSGNDSP